MNTQIVLIVAGIVAAYSIWLWQIFDKNTKSKPSPSSLLLWSIIDIIMWVNTVRAKNDDTLILSYAIATVLLTIVVFLKGEFKWDKRKDTFVAFVAAICLVVSYLTSPLIGVISGALSISIAGIPNMIGLRKAKINGLSLLNILFFISGPTVTLLFLESYEIKDLVYPVIAITYWIISLLLYLFCKKE